MAGNINREASKRIFLRMRDDGSKLTAICDVLAEVNPDADEDEVFLFVSDCVSTFASRGKKVARESRPERRESKTSSSSGCAGSGSDRPHC